MSEPVVLQWSGGKDSALALDALRDDPRYTLAGLLVTLTAEHDRVTMHGVHRALIEAQADALGLTMIAMIVSGSASNAAYEAALERALADVRARGIATVATGDIFLEDVRRYRQAQLQAQGMALHTPLWGEDPPALLERFWARGHRAIVVCTSDEHLDASVLGRELSPTWVAELPEGVDPCGERGEFHSFVVDGPHFARMIDCRPGAIVGRNGHHYCELELVGASEGR